MASHGKFAFHAAMWVEKLPPVENFRRRNFFARLHEMLHVDLFGDGSDVNNVHMVAGDKFMIAVILLATSREVFRPVQPIESCINVTRICGTDLKNFGRPECLLFVTVLTSLDAAIVDKNEVVHAELAVKDYMNVSYLSRMFEKPVTLLTLEILIQSQLLPVFLRFYDIGYSFTIWPARCFDLRRLRYRRFRLVVQSSPF